MKFSLNWLREWVPFDQDPEELARLLTLRGFEVDGLEPAGRVDSKVVVAELLSVERHPQADRLFVCQAAAGGGSKVQIVTGADNVSAGMKVPLALVGAVVGHDGEGEDKAQGRAIKATAFRGLASAGMLCSEIELGLGDDADGIMELDADSPVGKSMGEYLDLGDIIADISFTSNRGDCLSVRGLAREIAAICRLKAVAPAERTVAVSLKEEALLSLAPDGGCVRYCARVLGNLRSDARSPLWMRERLRRCGLRPRSPIVDITNYVALEWGQPLHAFDRERLSLNISVRRARPGESLEIIGGDRLELKNSEVLICDGDRPVALGGVMGGLGSAVSADTTQALFECALFPPADIRGAARRHGLDTEAARRYERGVDPSLQRRALERASGLAVDICGADCGPVAVAELPAVGEIGGASLSLRRTRLDRIAGVAIEDADVSELLTRLEISQEKTAEGWLVQVPSHRYDLEGEDDLIEEVVRHQGYDLLPEQRAPSFPAISPDPEAIEAGAIKNFMVERGYWEAIAFSFVSLDEARRWRPDLKPLELVNPVSSELPAMRTSLAPGLVRVLLHNLRRRSGPVRLFEWGRVFLPPADGKASGQDAWSADQPLRLGGMVSGLRWPLQWGDESRLIDFYDVKGDLENLFEHCALEVDWLPQSRPCLHPGQTAAIEAEGEQIGVLGRMAPQLEDELELAFPAFFFEISADRLIKRRVLREVEVSRFPQMRRDLSLVVPDAISAAEVLDAVAQVAPASLVQRKVFDLYRGAGVKQGHYALALALIFQDRDRTLTDEEGNEALSAVLQSLEQRLGIQLRSAGR